MAEGVLLHGTRNRCLISSRYSSSLPAATRGSQENPLLLSRGQFKIGVKHERWVSKNLIRNKAVGPSVKKAHPRPSSGKVPAFPGKRGTARGRGAEGRNRDSATPVVQTVETMLGS